MRYALLIYGNEAAASQRTPAENKEIMSAYYAFTNDVKASGNYVTGTPLLPTQAATTVRVKDGATFTTDGPFAETHEQLGGLYILECADLDEALALAARIPGAAHGSIEVRPMPKMG